MFTLRFYLVFSTLIIFTITFYALVTTGINWPAVYFGDILDLSWRTQFNLDFLMHLVLLAVWIAWREGFNAKGIIFGLLSILMGGMFGFPYLLYCIIKTNGKPMYVLLGIHAQKLN